MLQHNVISKSMQTASQTNLVDYTLLLDLLKQRFSSDSDSKKILVSLTNII